MGKRILAIDDDPVFLSEIGGFLGSHGFDVAGASDAPSMRQALREQSFDLFLLDLVLPGTSGKVLCRELVEVAQAGIIVVSALDDDEERIALLELGADDYIVKPFNPLELLARINAFFRRTSTRESRPARGFGPWALEEGDRRLTHKDGVVVALTPSEAQLIRLFLSSPNIVFDREELLAVSRVRQHGGSNDRSVDNLIKRLRRKVETDPANPRHLQTAWGKGYVFRP